MTFASEQKLNHDKQSFTSRRMLGIFNTSVDGSLHGANAARDGTVNVTSRKRREGWSTDAQDGVGGFWLTPAR